MDAVKYLKESKRMCEFYMDCRDCPLDEKGEMCTGYPANHPEEHVAIVERWSKEHKIKTNGGLVLELIPETARSGGSNIVSLQIQADWWYAPAEIKKTDDHDGCVNCRYESYPETDYPCCRCKNCYTDKWEKKE